MSLSVFDFDEGKNDDLVGEGKVELKNILTSGLRSLKSQKCALFFGKVVPNFIIKSQDAGTVYFDILVDDSEIRAEEERKKKLEEADK